jgi:hypothetical protein
VTLYRCCRHCVPAHPAHPARDGHDTPCGPAWCVEGSTPIEPDLFTDDRPNRDDLPDPWPPAGPDEVECPDCFGDGGEQGPDLDERGRPVRVPCSCCGGTGRVEA